MLRERSQLLQRLLFALDIVLIGVAWVLAWVVRFEVLDPPEWVPLTRYLVFLPPVLVLWSAVFLLSGLYQARRAQRLPLVVFAISRAVFLGLLASVTATFFYREFSFSRLHMLLFGVITSLLLVGTRGAIYLVLRGARAQGRNIRRVLIVGAGPAGQRLARAFRQYPWMGFEVLGFLDDRPAAAFTNGSSLPAPHLGDPHDLGAVMDHLADEGHRVDLVYAALPLSAAALIEQIAAQVAVRTAQLCLVPDLFHLDLLLHTRVSEVDGLPVLHLIDEAPFDLRRVVKRALDVAFALAVLAVLSPLFLAIALAVKLSSPGPVFYRQERMSLNGQTFKMLKFRSMPIDAEAGSGAVWAKPGERRATRVGAFLRRTSLDELPQFLNVLKGDMSVVGPRPERPVFIERFRHEIPGYMLRHKVRAGITGWAQVNGWRGNTSLSKRIEYDLYYIQHWSLAFDLKIMALTVWKGFVNENAY
ncbi:MAG TPA: undecaprenyl-phosphate glucose phosphotransferase [Rubricoccaceae bacterium]|nr:undecaprenyl-phosphate glucose phosphotransferase [Rubricoccaceae bacterium]